MTKTSPLLSKRFGAGTAAVLSQSSAGSPPKAGSRWWYAHGSIVLADCCCGSLTVALLVNPVVLGNCIDESSLS